MIIKQKGIYSKPILIKSCITILRKEEKIMIKGPLGVSFLVLPHNLSFKKIDLGLQLVSLNSCQNLILTYYKILSQKIRGVELGFFEVLVIHGIGWRVLLEKNILKFSIGFSHLV
jgi:large subunit ribosomal protein L6